MVGAVPWIPLVFIGAVLIAVTVARHRPQWRRVAVFALVIVVSSFTFATAVHSVHHLSEPQKAAECPVFSASQHVTGTLAEPSALFVPPIAITTTSAGACEAPAAIVCFQPAQPRAPPASSV
jgi:hypothetical protein